MNGALVLTSDSTLKQNIQPLPNALATIAQLQPKTFQFRTSEHPAMNLPTGTHIGFLAQQVQTVLPDLVSTQHLLPITNQLGMVLESASDRKALNYIDLIALAIGGIKQQQVTITQLQTQVAQMQAQLTACCPIVTPPSDGGRGMVPGAGAATERTAALSIAPNPLGETTTITYAVHKPGTVKLQVSSSEGRMLKSLREEEAQIGTFTYQWNTQGMSAGSYLVTLLIDDETIVKQVIKLDVR